MDLALHEDWHCAQCLLRVCKEEAGDAQAALVRASGNFVGRIAACCQLPVPAVLPTDFPKQPRKTSMPLTGATCFSRGFPAVLDAVG